MIVSPPERIVLHIGRQKTGTSVLQHALNDSKAALAEAGIVYAAQGRTGVAHHPLANSLLPKLADDPEAERVRGSVTAALARAGGGIWLFSSEAFQNIPEPARLAPIMDPARLDVIVYLREQYAFAQSAYAQRIRATRSTDSFADYLARFGGNHGALVSAWRDQLAPRRLIVRGYARSALTGGDIVDDFTVAAELGAVALTRAAKPQTPAFGGALLEFKRAVNVIPDLPEAYDRRAFATFSKIAALDPAYRVRAAVPADQVAAFRARFEAENMALRIAYPVLGDALVTPEPDPVPEFDARRSFARIWRRLRRHDRTLYRMLLEAVSPERFDEPEALTIIRAVRPE